MKRVRGNACRRSIARLLTTLAFVTLATAAHSSDRFSIGGYYKSFFVGYRLPAINHGNFSVDIPPLGSVSNRLRLDAMLRPHQDVSFALSYDFAPRVQDPVLFAEPVVASFFDPGNYRVDDLKPRLYPSVHDNVASFAILQNLDRAFVEIRTKGIDFFVGRQPIAWGSARAVNPTDILAPFTYETLDTEDRVGIDAVRARVPLGFMGELDIGYVFGKNFEFEKSAMFLRTKFYAAQTDFSLLALGYRENLLLGIDLTRSIGGAGFWLEAAHSFADVFADSDSPGAEDFFRATVGGDYNLGGEVYAFVEYHFNQAGGDDPAEYSGNLFKTAYAEGSTYLMGRHYLIPGMSHQLTPLVTANMETLWNLSDWSAYLAPSVEYNAAENIYLAGGVFVGLGKGPEMIMGTRSEFGSYPDILFTSFRLYF